MEEVEGRQTKGQQLKIMKRCEKGRQKCQSSKDTQGFYSTRHRVFCENQLKRNTFFSVIFPKR